MVFNRTKNINLSTIKKIELLAAKTPDVVSLAQGIPSFDTPESIKQRVYQAIADGKVAKYSLCPGLPALREVIEENLASENMFYDFQTEIIVTAGSIEGITATLLTILDPDDEVILFNPTYVSYAEAIKVAGGRPFYVALNERNNWSLDTLYLKSAINKKTKAILICNPNNPTGTIFNKKQLLQIAGLAEKHDLFILIDEVYKDFIFNKGSESKIGAYFSLAQIPELRKRIVRFFSFSKAYAMTGWRVGYLHSDKSVASEILKVHDNLVTCAPVVSQYAALAALEMGKENINNFKNIYQERRDLVCHLLDKFSDFFSYKKPQATYFVFPKILIKNIKSLDFAVGLIEKAKVAVVPGVAFGSGGEGHIRINFGRKEEDIIEGIRRIGEYLLRV